MYSTGSVFQITIDAIDIDAEGLSVIQDQAKKKNLNNNYIGVMPTILKTPQIIIYAFTVVSIATW